MVVGGGCGGCGEQVPPGARFCPSCGSRVEASVRPPQRRLVSVFFCDLADSTALGERLDAEAVRSLLSRYFERVQAAVERHGGRVEKFIGDAVVALFGVPHAHEDDAARSVRAAAEACAAVREFGDELERTLGLRVDARVGVCTGEVVVGWTEATQRIATGDAMNTAARLQSAAPVGSVLLDARTYRLSRGEVMAEPIAPLRLKGKAAPVEVYGLLGVRQCGARGTRPGTAMVGRQRELRMLHDAFERACATRSCQLVSVLGTAGLGKSRLVGEFRDAIATEATMVGGRCLSYGEGITYWALAEALRALAGVRQGDSRDEVRERLRALVSEDASAAAVVDDVGSFMGLAGARAHVEEARIALRLLLETCARRRPLVLVLDDVHYAEPPLLDVVDYLASSPAGGRILLICMSRPELLDQRPAWGEKPNAHTVLLEPLSAADTARLVARLLGGDAPGALCERLVRAAEGNPLFAEELVALLAEQGRIRHVDGRIEPVGSVDRLVLPETIQAVLSARLDRLSDAERRVVECASVEGQVFHLGTLQALGVNADGGRVVIQNLARKQLFCSERASIPGQDAYRFRHLLIREVAYQRIAKEVRARWHEQFADWLAGLAGERCSEYEEILAHHLAAAARCREDIGLRDERTAGLSRHASRLYRDAADRNAARGELEAGAALLDQAAQLLPADNPVRALALADRASWLEWTQPVDVRLAIADEAIAAALASRDRGVQLVANAVSAYTRLELSADYGMTTATARRDATALRAAAIDCERETRLEAAARLWSLAAAWDGYWLLRCHRGVSAAVRASALAERAGAPWLGVFATWDRCRLTMHGPGRIAELIDVGGRMVRGLGRFIQSDYLDAAAHLSAQAGDVRAAFRFADEAAAIARERGESFRGRWIRAGILIDAGEPRKALPYLVDAKRSALEHEHPGDAAILSGHLARSHALTGAYDRALEEAAYAEALCPPADIRPHLIWRGAAVRALAGTQRSEDARHLANTIRDLLADVECPGVEFHARLDAATGYQAAGEVHEADQLLRRAHEESVRRGAHAFAREATAELARRDEASSRNRMRAAGSH